VDSLVLLCAAEFCRTHPKHADRRDYVSGQEVLLKECQAAFRALYQNSIHSRIVVKGMKQQDLNDRIGTIQYWDASKGKFYVGLDSGKGKNLHYMMFFPGNLEALPLDSVRNKSKKGNKTKEPVYLVFIPNLYKNQQLMFEVHKSMVDGMIAHSSNPEPYLAQLMEQRTTDERLAREAEELFRQQEEADRERRAEQRRRENDEWARQKQEYAQRKADYQQWKRQQRKEQWQEEREYAQRRASASSSRGGGGERHHPDCKCPRCVFEHIFFAEAFGGGFGGGGPGIRFASFGGGGGGGFGGCFRSAGARGGMPFFFEFGEEGDDDSGDDEWDSRYEQLHEEELEKRNQECADLLDIDVDATETEIKKQYRRLALKYVTKRFPASLPLYFILLVSSLNNILFPNFFYIVAGTIRINTAPRTTTTAKPRTKLKSISNTLRMLTIISCRVCCSWFSKMFDIVCFLTHPHLFLCSQTLTKTSRVEPQTRPI
jgi:hypothetical protein